jgi:2-methylcitrate dehydratase PrpD
MLGGTRDQVINAVSNAWIDGGALRTYRHAPNTARARAGQRATPSSRGPPRVDLAHRRDGLSSALSAKTWGF